MTGINIKQFLNNFAQNYTRQTANAQNTYNASAVQISSQTSQAAENLAKNTSTAASSISAQNLQLNTLQNMDRAIYLKDVMQLPRNANELIYMLQRGITQSRFNQIFSTQLAAQKNTLSQLQAQILAQLQGINSANAEIMANIRLTDRIQASLKNLEILSGCMINLSQISLLLQQNGKEAVTKLIMSMTDALKSGITDLSQMKEMAKFINAVLSAASENNPQKTLKLLLLLYLPWLPLEDSVGFDLEIQKKEEGEDENDSILIITVTTINFGVVKAVLVLETPNSVHAAIEASEDFPQKELRLRIEGEQRFYAMNSVISFDTNSNIKALHTKQAAGINMSRTTEINPYMLLMAHTLIKHIIDIDNNTTLGITSHTDIGL